MNTQTMETVPVSMNGNVVYGLSYSDNCLYGLNLVSNAEGNTTYVFSYNLETKQIKNILKFANEDAEAFTFVDDGKLFTNIGKNKIYCYNINTKKIFSYNRSASIPQKSVKKGNSMRDRKNAPLILPISTGQAQPEPYKRKIHIHITTAFRGKERGK